MSKIYHFLPFIFLCVVAPLFAQHDSTYYSNLIHERVWDISYKKDSDVAWIIAGENRDKIYKVKKNKIRNITEEACLPQNNIYNSILCINSRHVLLGTKNNYIFYLRNAHKYKWLNQQYGLRDSSIASIDFKKEEKKIYVTTPTSRYVLKHYTHANNLCFIEDKDTVNTLNKVGLFMKRYIQEPLQAGICFMASNVDFNFKTNKLINEKALREIRENIQPGDIIIKRSDYQLTNVGIPGFWTHAGIYVGSLAELDSCYKDLPFLDGQNPSLYLLENYPVIYQKIVGQKNLITEAIGEGVVLNPLEHIAKSDYLAVLRPNLAKADIFQSLLSAFDYYGTLYDYLFDFDNDDYLVCSELVYQSFRPTPEKKGLTFQFGTLNGKPFLAPNDFARQYALEYKTDKEQLKLIYFFDAKIHIKRSVNRNEHEFAKTWKRKP